MGTHEMMYEAIVETIFKTNLEEIEIHTGYVRTKVTSKSKGSHILKVNLFRDNNVLLTAGTCIHHWSINHDLDDYYVDVCLYLDQHSLEIDKSMKCMISFANLLTQSNAYRDRLSEAEKRLQEVEEKYRALEKKYRALEKEYNDVYNRPPELGGPGYVEAMADFNIRGHVRGKSV